MIWSAAACAMIVIALAQLDEHRRYRAALSRHATEVTHALAERSAQSAAMEQYLRGERRLTQEPVVSAIPPPPPIERYQVVSRVRRGVGIAAFAMCGSLGAALLVGGADFARKHGQFVAHAMLALAFFATAGMLCGWGYWRNWNRFNITDNAAGWGLVFIPFSLLAMLAAHRKAKPRSHSITLHS
jgi:hypothetical protein